MSERLDVDEPSADEYVLDSVLNAYVHGLWPNYSRAGLPSAYSYICELSALDDHTDGGPAVKTGTLSGRAR